MGVIRKTKSVQTLLDIFTENKEAISAVQLIELLKEKMNKTTIYRILERLESDGIVHSFVDKDGLKWYATCTDGCSSSHHVDIHPHFQCQDCGKVDCLSVEMTIPRIPNRTINFSQILLIGRCEECL
ncbi:Fur family transcriptional regulator [uncultured Kordia sp.]|uniref:Fur family transcriptional regulator n=1 Tax=uncultured Kordia sp. TaxID=507699 RepID=UPI0026204B1B|nr:transcriptional repressor [uncultured Kordia sp.]